MTKIPSLPITTTSPSFSACFGTRNQHPESTQRTASSTPSTQAYSGAPCTETTTISDFGHSSICLRGLQLKAAIVLSTLPLSSRLSLTEGTLANRSWRCEYPFVSTKNIGHTIKGAKLHQALQLRSLRQGEGFSVKTMG